MVQIVSPETRQFARQQQQAVKDFIVSLRQVQRKKQTPQALRQQTRRSLITLQQKREAISKRIKEVAPRIEKLQQVIDLPTKKEAITSAKQRFQSELQQAKRAVDFGVNIKQLPSGVRKIAERIELGETVQKQLQQKAFEEVIVNLESNLQMTLIPEIRQEIISRLEKAKPNQEVFIGDLFGVDPDVVEVGGQKFSVAPELQEKFLREKILGVPPVTPLVEKLIKPKVGLPLQVTPERIITPEERIKEVGRKIKEGVFEFIAETPAEKQLKEVLLERRVPSRRPVPAEDFVFEEIKRKELVPTGTEIVNLTPREKTFFEKQGLNPNDPGAIALKSNVEDISRRFADGQITEEVAEKEFGILETEFIRKKITEGFGKDAAAGLAYGLIRKVPIVGQAVDVVLVGSLVANRDKIIAQSRRFPKETAIASGLFLIGAKAGTSIVSGVKLRTQPNFEQINARSRLLSNKETTKIVDQVREFDNSFSVNLKNNKVTDTIAYDVSLADGTMYRVLQYIKLDRPTDKGGIKGTVEGFGIELNPKAKGIKIGKGVIPGEPEIVIARGVEQVGLKDTQGRFTIFKIRPKNTRLGRLAQRLFGSGQVFDVAQRGRVIGARPGLIRKEAVVRTEAVVINIKNISGRLFRQIERVEKKIQQGRKINLNEIKRLVNLRRQLEGKEIFTEKEFRESGFRTITDINIISLLKRLKVTKQIGSKLGVIDLKRKGKGFQFDVIFKKEKEIPGVRRKAFEERVAIGEAFTRPVKRLITVKKKPIREGATIAQLESRLKTIGGGLKLLKKDLPVKEKRISLTEFKKRMDKLFPTKEALLEPFKPPKKVKGISKAKLIARANKLFGKQGGQLLKKELRKPEVKEMTLTQFKARMTRLFGTKPPELLKLPIPKREKPITKSELIKRAEKLFGKEKARLLEKELPQPKEKGVTIKELRKRLIKINRQARIQQIKLAREALSRRVKPIVIRIKELVRKKKKERLSADEITGLQALQLEKKRLEGLPSIVQPDGRGISILPLRPAPAIITAIATKRVPPPRVSISPLPALGVLVRDKEFIRELERLVQAQRTALLQAQNQRLAILEATTILSPARITQLNKVSANLRTRLKQIQLQKQKLAQKQRPERRRPLITEPRVTKFPRLIKVPPPPFIPLTEAEKKRRLLILKAKAQQGWNTFVKQRGKFLKANLVPRTRNKALDLASWITDRTTSRQFLVKKSKKSAQRPKIKTPRDYFKTTRKKYRPFKIRKGIKKPLEPNRFIEKTAFAIDTLGEKKQLSAAREIARLKKKFLKRIPSPRFKRR